MTGTQCAADCPPAKRWFPESPRQRDCKQLKTDQQKTLIRKNVSPYVNTYST